MGGVVFAPTMLGVLKGCSPSTGRWRPELFTASQAALVTALSDTIIPATDTKGAADVGVPGFIESMVKDVYSEEQRTSFLDGLERFDEKCREQTGSAFASLDAGAQTEFANTENRLAIENEAEEGPQFFLVFKELTMVGYFRTEEGATRVLRYEDIPGIYQGCIPFEDVGRTWSHNH